MLVGYTDVYIISLSGANLKSNHLASKLAKKRDCLFLPLGASAILVGGNSIGGNCRPTVIHNATYGTQYQIRIHCTSVWNACTSDCPINCSDFIIMIIKMCNDSNSDWHGVMDSLRRECWLSILIYTSVEVVSTTPDSTSSRSVSQWPITVSSHEHWWVSNHRKLAVFFSLFVKTK